MLQITNEDTIKIAADELIQALTDLKAKQNLQIKLKYYEALKNLTKIFNQALKSSPIVLKLPKLYILKDHSTIESNKNDKFIIQTIKNQK